MTTEHEHGQPTRMLFLGEESLADGFRLIGFETHPNPTPEEVDRVFRDLSRGRDKAFVVVDDRVMRRGHPEPKRVRREGGRIVVIAVPPLKRTRPMLASEVGGPPGRPVRGRRTSPHPVAPCQACTGVIVNQVQELERAILARAERLASEFRERASRSRDSILREAAERLRLREAARGGHRQAPWRNAPSASRSRPANCKMQSQLDRVRWNLVQDVERRLARADAGLHDGRGRLRAWLRSTDRRRPPAQIEARASGRQANARDHQRLCARWDSIDRAPARRARRDPGRRPHRHPGRRAWSRSADGRIRVDHTFEGRLDRLRPRIQQVILERLLPGGFDTGNLFTG